MRRDFRVAIGVAITDKCSWKFATHQLASFSIARALRAPRSKPTPRGFPRGALRSPHLGGFALFMRGRFWRGSMWRWSLDIATLARAARPGDRTSGARGDPQPSPVPTKGSRHPDRRRRPLLRGRAGVQSLGPCEGMASLQDAPARAERTSGLAAFARRHGVSALLEGGDPTAGIAAEPSLRGRDPCRVSASHRHAPLHPRLVRRKSVASARNLPRVELRESDGREIGRREHRQRAWLLTRALITLGTTTKARRKRGFRGRTRTGAARPARRRIEGSYGCARASKTYGRSRKFDSSPVDACA